MNLSLQIFISLILGVVVGLFVGPEGMPFLKLWIAPIGTMFLNLIKMIIVPIVLASLVVGVASLGNPQKLGRMGIKVITFYMLTTAIAIIIGICVALVLTPGVGLNIPADLQAATKKAPPLMDVITNMIPANPFKAMVDAAILPVIVFAIFIGIGITMAGEKAKPLYNFFDALAEVSYKIIELVMRLAPLGVFALIVPVVAVNGPRVLLPLLSVIVAVYLACVLHILFTYIPALMALGKMGPIKFFKATSEAMLIAFTTCASAATIPINMKNTQEKLGVSKEVSSFVLPLGATINMDGTALYQGVCALFVANAFGIELSLGQMCIIVVTATLASVGTAGVPGSGLIMLTMVLQSVNLPLEGIALVAGIDRVLDMARTTVNITGDTVASVVINASEGVNEDTKDLGVSANA